jgi:thiamine-monophosphate kinase
MERVKHSATIAELGEQAVIAAIHRLQPPVPQGTRVGIGDDAAVIAPRPGQELLVSVDMLVEGVHFRRDWMDPEQVGAKAVAVNASDIAAMGGEPYAYLTSVALPGDLPVAWVDGFYRGFARTADEYGAALIGGDTVTSPGPVVIDVTVLGWAEAPVLRRGAVPGDRLVVTGRLGASRAGLELLKAGRRWPGRRGAERAVLARHMQPVARVAAGRLLGARAHALTDISDDLVLELGELTRFGGVGAVVDAERLPIDGPTRTVAASLGQDIEVWALYGGEDYELLAAIPPSAEAALMAELDSLGVPLTVIGEVVDRPGLWILRDGQEVPLNVHHPASFQHFGGADG